MRKTFGLDQVSFSASGSNMEYRGSESGGFTVLLHGDVGFVRKTVRLKIDFTGVASIRIGDPDDGRAAQSQPVCLIHPSRWREEALDDYVHQFGTKLLPAVSDIRHFLVRGHDVTVSVLARHVRITESQ